MKQEARKQLIRDIITAMIAWIVVGGIMAISMDDSFWSGIFFGWLFAGIPFGWRWLDRVFIAVSLLSIVLKGIASVFLGWIALPVVIVKDIIEYINA